MSSDTLTLLSFLFCYWIHQVNVYILAVTVFSSKISIFLICSIYFLRCSIFPLVSGVFFLICWSIFIMILLIAIKIISTFVSSQCCISSSLFLYKLRLSWFFVCQVILDCILKILNIVLQRSGSCLNAMVNIDFYFNRHLIWLSLACNFSLAFSWLCFQGHFSFLNFCSAI